MEGGLKQGASYHIGLHYIASLKHTVGQRRTVGRLIVRARKGAKGASFVLFCCWDVVIVLFCFLFFLGGVVFVLFF